MLTFNACNKGRTMSNKVQSVSDVVISIVRVFDAPRSMVWSAWTEPQRLSQWWGPHGYNLAVCEIDLRKGGSISRHMQAPDGTIHPEDGTISEVVAPERLVTATAVRVGDSVVFEALTVVTFEESDGKTTVTIRQTYSNVAPAAARFLGGAQQGWTQSLERLEIYLR
jgi:uncharacterized protein YndB with AHSA1/START domain